MVATIIFFASILGVYAVLIRSYQMVTLARYRDNARAVLTTFTDQFGRLQTADAAPGGGSIIRPLFQPDTWGAYTPNSFGLSWADAEGDAAIAGSNAAPITVTLGDPGSSPISAQVTRQIQYLDPATGMTVNTPPASAAGWILQGTFTIQYTVDKHLQTQQLTVARSVYGG
jgi:hypothetical protein